MKAPNKPPKKSLLKRVGKLHRNPRIYRDYDEAKAAAKKVGGTVAITGPKSEGILKTDKEGYIIIGQGK